MVVVGGDPISRFTEVLTVSPLDDGKTWFTRREFGYDVRAEGSGDTIEVPVTFMTDFASVPRPLWVILPRWGKYGNAAVIHDYCYWAQKRSRKESDAIFLEAMGVLEVSPVVKYLMYWAVRIFGGLAWSGNLKKKKKLAGFKPLVLEKEIKFIEKPETLGILL